MRKVPSISGYALRIIFSRRNCLFNFIYCPHTLDLIIPTIWLAYIRSICAHVSLYSPVENIISLCVNFSDFFIHCIRVIPSWGASLYLLTFHLKFEVLNIFWEFTGWALKFYLVSLLWTTTGAVSFEKNLIN